MLRITLLAFATLAVGVIGAQDTVLGSVGDAVGNLGNTVGDLTGALLGSPEANAYLLGHNQVRINHNAVPLQWNQTLADAAAQWASTCRLEHSSGSLFSFPYGENIVAATGQFAIATAVEQFTLDKSDYDPSNPTYIHFTQVVWKSTTDLGCALAQCDGMFDSRLGLASYYVCLYSPAGNIVGDAPANVQV